MYGAAIFPVVPAVDLTNSLASQGGPTECLHTALKAQTFTAAAAAAKNKAGGQADYDPISSAAAIFRTIDCSDLKEVGKCFRAYIADQSDPEKKEYDNLRSKICEELEKDTTDFAEIGKFCIRLFTCTSAGLCGTPKADAQAQKVSVEAARAMLSGTPAQCAIDKGNMRKWLGLAAIVAISLVIGALYAGRASRSS
jgi:hypothetical protein